MSQSPTIGWPGRPRPRACPSTGELLANYLAGLPPDAYPNAAAVAPQMIGQEDAAFEIGLEAIVRGIRSMEPGPDEG